VVSKNFKPSNLKAKPSQQLCDVKGPAVLMMRYPFPFQCDSQDSCPQRPADMGPSLTPIQECVCELAAKFAGCLQVNAKGRKRLCSSQGEVMRIVAARRNG
jgi:hypothetical protein